jgi:hypothetical protein
MLAASSVEVVRIGAGAGVGWGVTGELGRWEVEIIGSSSVVGEVMGLVATGGSVGSVGFVSSLVVVGIDVTTATGTVAGTARTTPSDLTDLRLSLIFRSSFFRADFSSAFRIFSSSLSCSIQH